MRGMRQGVLPEQQSDHTHAQAHGLQAVPVWSLRQGVSEDGRSTTTPGRTASSSTGPRLSLPSATPATRQRQTITVVATTCRRLSRDTCSW